MQIHNLFMGEMLHDPEDSMLSPCRKTHLYLIADTQQEVIPSTAAAAP